MIFFIEDVEIIWKSFIFFFSSQHFSSCFLHLCQRAFYRIFNVIPFLYISSLFTYTYLFFGIPLVIIKCILQSCIPSRVSLLPKPFSVDLCGCRNLNVVSPECGATSAHPPPLSLSLPLPASFPNAETDLNLWTSRQELVNCLLKFHSEICL